MKLLSRSEEIVLMAIWKLQGNAYGVTIREKIFEDTGQRWSIGAVYAPLHRIEKKGLVKSYDGDPVPERGGRSKVYYDVTSKGKKSLIQMKEVNESIWNNAPNLGVDKA
jgi:DNA-binding PadR family transcriptional regulator